MNPSGKTAIFNAALIEFGSKGYRLASTNQIAMNANTSKGLIFKYFQSKSHLYFELFQVCLEDFMKAYRLVDLSSYSNPIEKIVAYVHWKELYFKEHSYSGRILLEGFSNPPPELAIKISELMIITKDISIESLFKTLDRTRLRSDVTEEQFIKMIQIGVSGMQSVYIHKGMSDDELATIREENYLFLKILIRGMESSHE